MDLTRFEQLCDAYGGDIRRWPAEDQEAARRLAATAAAAVALLEREAALDDLLVSAPAPTPSAALRERILAAAPRSRSRRLSLGWLWPAGVGAGLAAAGVAGVLVGAAFSGQGAPDDVGLIALDSSPGLTAFGEVTDVLEG